MRSANEKERNKIRQLDKKMNGAQRAFVFYFKRNFSVGFFFHDRKSSFAILGPQSKQLFVCVCVLAPHFETCLIKLLTAA